MTLVFNQFYLFTIILSINRPQDLELIHSCTIPNKNKNNFRCQKAGWGFPSTGLPNISNVCQADKTWNLTKLEDCICKSCSTCKVEWYCHL